jgi:hypothetical protein
MMQNNTNKKKSCIRQPSSLNGMAILESDQKKRIKSYIEAFKSLSEKDPDGFESIAPELLRRSVWNWRGADPYFSERLSLWLDKECLWTPFHEIIPESKNTVLDRPAVNAPSKEHLSSIHKELFSRLEEKFDGDYNRWDAAIRDQFIVLGMLAIAGKGGEKQGRMVHNLGISEGENGLIQGSNAIRAAKIAISRMAKPMKIFSPAKGHGYERVHSFSDSNTSDLVARYVLSHDASTLLPQSLLRNSYD